MKRWKSAVIIGIFLFISLGIQANDNWHEGVLIMKNDEVMVGKVSLHQSGNIVRFQKGESQFTYSAFQVSSFNIHDEEMGAIRRFVSIPFQENTGKFTDVFFEVIISDEVSLLRRENPPIGYNEYEGSTTNSVYISQVFDYDFYFEYKGLIIASSRFKKEMKPMLDLTLQNSLHNFIKDNKLNLNRTYDQVLLIRFYNKMYNAGEVDFLTSN